jgi:hypothetical protein
VTSIDADRAYDSFVIRLWRHAVTGHWARAEVEHFQSGAVERVEQVPPDWICQSVSAFLHAPLTGPADPRDTPAIGAVDRGPPPAEL